MVSVVVLLAAAVTPIVLRNGDSPRRVAAVTSPTEAPTTLTEPPTSTTTTEVVASSTSLATTTTTRPKPTTTIAKLVCRNSYNPACGPFRWDPAPGPNEPSTVQITYTPASPRVGDQVTFHVTYTNPDGPAGSDESSIKFGDGGGQGIAASIYAPPGGCKTPYGPWTPPAPKADSVSSDWPTHAYTAAGTYTVTETGSAGVGLCDPQNPYLDEKSGTTTITISP